MTVPTICLNWKKNTRLVETCYPPIDIFADLSEDHDDNMALWALEYRTNPRYQSQHWELGLVRNKDVVHGETGAAIVMAAVMYVGGANMSRFSDGSFGAYYAGHALDTALHEFAFQAERYRRNHNLGAERVEARAWHARPIRPLHDVRGPKYTTLRDPNPTSYPTSAAFARQLREQDSWGIVYQSVRHKEGECIAIFRPPAISMPQQGGVYEFNFDGQRITEVSERRAPILKF
jgi:hypothetical protein